MATFRVFGVPVTLDFSPPPTAEEVEPFVVAIEQLDQRISEEEDEGKCEELIDRRWELVDQLDEAGLVDHSGSSEDEGEEVEEEPQQSSGFLWGLFG